MLACGMSSEGYWPGYTAGSTKRIWMNTASNWPMGSSLAQLNLELQDLPFATAKSQTSSHQTLGVSPKFHVAVLKSEFSSDLAAIKLRVDGASKDSLNKSTTDETMRWTQTR